MSFVKQLVVMTTPYALVSRLESLDNVIGEKKRMSALSDAERLALIRHFDAWAHDVGVRVRREDGAVLLSPNFALDDTLPYSIDLTYARFCRAYGDELASLHALWSQVRRLRVLVFEGAVPALPLPVTFLRPFVRLEQLTIISVELKTLPDAFGDVPALRLFTITHCALHALPRSLSECLHLEQVVVHHNNICELEPALISRLRRLTWLVVAYNVLEKISPACFESVSSTNGVLERLDFSYNQLCVFPFGSLEHIASLRYVNVSSNVNLVSDSRLFDKCASPEIQLNVNDTLLAQTMRCTSPRVRIL